MITRSKEKYLKRKRPFSNNPLAFFESQANTSIETTPELIIEERANLYTYPVIDTEHTTIINAQFTIGDMHGNALKFIYFLIKQNIMQMNAADYKDIVRIYTTPVNDLTTAHLKKFNAILAKTTISSLATIRLLGDTLADRGSNDYFTLKILEKISPLVNLEIVLSNHDCEFIEVYEKGLKNFSSSMGKQARSLFNLGTLIEKHLVSANEVESILINYYFPKLKLISYSLDEHNNITLYSHAPIGFNSIKALAKEFNIYLHDKTAKELANTIEEINKVFSETIHMKQLILTSKLYEALEQNIKITRAPMTFPIVRTIWSREYQKKDMPIKTKHGYFIYYIHGHDGEGFVKKQFKDREINLDNLFGKSWRHKGEYCVLFTNDHNLTQQRQEFKTAEQSTHLRHS